MLLTSCSVDKSDTTGQDIFIVNLDNDFDSSGNFTLTDATETIHFSNDFWNYFIKTHQSISYTVFVSPVYKPDNNFLELHLGDTSLSYYVVTDESQFFFKDIIADSINGKEKNNFISGDRFIHVTGDSTTEKERKKEIDQRLKDYQITPDVNKEFAQFKNIVTGVDTSHHYVIIFRKSVADKIVRLYEE